MDNDHRVRLQKILAERGLASRRSAEKLIAEGHVKVNGLTVTELGTKVDSEHDQITVDDKAIIAKQSKRYLLLYKPAGWITSVKDEQGRRTVMDLLYGVSERVYPVGRLDYNTSGILLFTNDGDLTNLLLHPSREVEKTYHAVIEGDIGKDKLDLLRKGIRLEDGLTAPAKVKKVRFKDNKTLLEITIHEGKNRQVRRMLSEVGFECLHLKRVQFAFLTLTGMKPGEWRDLTEAEIEKLKELKTLSPVHISKD